MRLIDADKLKAHFAWWNDENKDIFNSIIDQQPTVKTANRVRTIFDHKNGIWRFYCECGKDLTDMAWLLGLPNYCPECGGKMIGAWDED